MELASAVQREKESRRRMVCKGRSGRASVESEGDWARGQGVRDGIQRREKGSVVVNYDNYY